MLLYFTPFRRFGVSVRMGRGAFIVFEGLDRSGKSTQCKKTLRKLEEANIPCSLQSFPDRTTAIGKIISQYLTRQIELEDHAVHLLFAANRWELIPKIKEQLDKGITVIVDRYSYSGVVYTSAKKGFSMDWCKQPEVGLLKPDLVIFLRTSTQVLSERSNLDDERYETASFQSRVLQNYLSLKEQDWREIDGSMSIDAVNEEILKHVKPVIESVKTTPVRQLWTEHVDLQKSSSPSGKSENQSTEVH